MQGIVHFMTAWAGKECWGEVAWQEAVGRHDGVRWHGNMGWVGMMG